MLSLSNDVENTVNTKLEMEPMIIKYYKLLFIEVRDIHYQIFYYPHFIE